MQPSVPVDANKWTVLQVDSFREGFVYFAVKERGKNTVHTQIL